MSQFVERVLEALAARRRVRLDELTRDPLNDADVVLLEQLSLTVSEGSVVLGADVELLDTTAILERLEPSAAGWAKTLEVRAHIGSTNSTLMQQAEVGSVDGVVLTAEAQLAGRGRRGRQWLSPFARNLALSFGRRVRRPVAEAGAVSLMVGLGVVDAIETMGVTDVQLKWPNDVLLDGRKLAGILIELPRATEPLEVVVGIGVNVGAGRTVAAAIEHDVADLREVIPVSRNELAAGILSAVHARLTAFDASGFSPAAAGFDARHRYHRQHVNILQGDATVTGRVLGVADTGELRLSVQGNEHRYSSGEVSLRGADVF